MGKRGAIYAVMGRGWYVTFRSEKKADEYCIHVRNKYGDMVWVERVN